MFDAGVRLRDSAGGGRGGGEGARGRRGEGGVCVGFVEIFEGIDHSLDLRG